MSLDPVVSIILPVYNAEEYVSMAIQSILHQTYTDFELIIINDGSSDNSLAIIDSFVDRRIRRISQENKGLVNSLNYGISISKGEFIARMDADDVSHPSRLQLQVNEFRKNKKLVLCSASIIAFSDSGIRKYRFFPLSNDEIRAEFLFNSGIVHPLAMFKASIVSENNITFDPSYDYCEDYRFFFELLQYGEALNLPKFLLDYRLLPTSQTAKGNQSILDRFEKISLIQQEVLSLIDFTMDDKSRLLNYRLSLSDGIRDIDFEDTSVSYILNYLKRIILLNDNRPYCSRNALIANFGEKLIKILLFSRPRLGVIDTIRIISSKMFLFGVVSVLKKRVIYGR